jgi:hypothetical protein
MGDYDELRAAIAAGPTEGKWNWWTSNSYNRLSTDADCRDGGVLRAVKYSDGVAGIEGREEDLAYIAAANPETIAALLAERDAMAVNDARYRWLRDECDTTTGFLLGQRIEADEWDAAIDAARGEEG